MADDKFIEETLEVHNAWRARHGVPELRHSEELSNMAQAWAENVARKGRCVISDNHYKEALVGENIAMKWTSFGDDFTGRGRGY